MEMLLGFMSKYRILDKIMEKESPVIKPGENEHKQLNQAEPSIGFCKEIGRKRISF